MDADRAFKNFFKRKSGFPGFKKKGKSDVKMYFVKSDAKTVIPCERPRVKIPTLGWVRLEEKGYIPVNAGTHVIKSWTVSKKAGRYYVSLLVEEPGPEKPQLNGTGPGIGLGIKEFAVLGNGDVYKNINKTAGVKKAEKQLKREQRRLSRKYGSLNKQNKKQKGEAARQNIQKQKLKVQKLHQRLFNIRTDNTSKVISGIVKTKLSLYYN